MAVYRIQVNEWAFVQPFAQYLYQPKGTGEIPDAKVFGMQAGITFQDFPLSIGWRCGIRLSGDAAFVFSRYV